MGTVSENHPCSKEYLEQQKNRRSKNVPSKPVKSKPKSCMARSLPRPERLQRPVLTNFSSSKPPIPFPLDLLPRLPGASANPPGTAAVCSGTAFCTDICICWTECVQPDICICWTECL